jgi:hypothetical protein
VDSNKTLDDLLARIDEVQDEDVARTTLQGRALSRSTDNLHLAVRTGILAIPLLSIERVISVPGARPDIVRVVVKNPSAVQTLYQAASSTEGHRQRGEWIGSGPGVGVSTCDYYDTSTITGGQADQCDDNDADCHADDLAQ